MVKLGKRVLPLLQLVYFRYGSPNINLFVFYTNHDLGLHRKVKHSIVEVAFQVAKQLILSYSTIQSVLALLV